MIIMSDFHYYEDIYDEIYDAHNDIMLIIYLSKQEKIIVLWTFLNLKICWL